MEEVVLWMEKCKVERRTPNTIMMCIRTDWIMQNDRDIFPQEFNAILQSSNSAGIVRT
ncbi:MAG: hypothetical protein O8C67_09825 [Candidatus Methanoperedens sp.]|jgi:hypothetical protein|nr:hypothetical protein [Candidatus Methanoperedens sp.]